MNVLKTCLLVSILFLCYTECYSQQYRKFKFGAGFNNGYINSEIFNNYFGLLIYPEYHINDRQTIGVTFSFGITETRPAPHYGIIDPNRERTQSADLYELGLHMRRYFKIYGKTRLFYGLKASHVAYDEDYNYTRVRGGDPLPEDKFVTGFGFSPSFGISWWHFVLSGNIQFHTHNIPSFYYLQTTFEIGGGRKRAYRKNKIKVE